MALLARAVELLQGRNVAWRWIPSAPVWRGRDDPLGERAKRIDEPEPILSGPIDNYTPRIVTNRLVDQLVRLQYQELNVRAVWDKIGIYMCERQRYRRWHHNSVVYPPPYSMVFKDTSKPLFVDVGSGDGKVILLLAKRNPHINYLGLDKRPKRVEISNRFKEALQLDNVHFICCNATVSFKTVCATYPGPLTYVTILSPDPHLRPYIGIRMVRSALVFDILECLAPGGKVLFQTEYLSVANYLRRYFDRHLGASLSVVDGENTGVYDEDGWLLMNPIGVRTETEIDDVVRGFQVYRRLYERTTEKFERPPLGKPRLFDPEMYATHPSKRLTKEEFRALKFEQRREYYRIVVKKRVRRLKEELTEDIILNWETYPRGWFERLMTTRGTKAPKRIRDPKPRILPLHKRGLPPFL